MFYLDFGFDPQLELTKHNLKGMQFRIIDISVKWEMRTLSSTKVFSMRFLFGLQEVSEPPRIRHIILCAFSLFEEE